MPSTSDAAAPFGQRTLAAIMFTDVVNYSEMVGENEDRTLDAVRRDFKLMSALVAQASGQVLKTLGDGLLVHFASAVNAVACAQGIQIAVENAAVTRPAGLNLKNRIGIHLGDVFVTANDVLGNGVNIAARLQTRAEPGGICISQTVFDVVRHKLTLQVKYLGPQELNHIRDSIPIYLLLPLLGPSAEPTTLSGRPFPAPSPTGKPKPVTLEFPLHTPPRTAPARRSEIPLPADESFCIGVLADFSGRCSHGRKEPPSWHRPLLLDVDNFEDVYSKLQVCLRLPAYNRPGETIELRLESLDQFHPDELLRNVAPLKKLWSLRSALMKPATAEAAAAELRALLSAAYPSDPAATPSPSASESDADTLARLLARPPPTHPNAPQKSTPANPVEAFVRNLAAGSSTPVRAVNQGGEVVALEMELTSQLRAILHHPDFQALEAAWRGVQLLVRDFGDGETVKLFLIDVSKAELLADLAGGEDVKSSHLANLLGGQTWDVLLGDLSFGANEVDIGLLDQLAKLAASSDAVFLGGAKAELVGCESFGRKPDSADWDIALPPEVDQKWQALRRSPAAGRVALAAPRVLLRQPYGKGSDTIEAFAFEELPPSLPHESYLWGNASFACGHMLAAGFTGGASPRNHLGGDLSGLPLHKFTEDGATVVKPCAEAWLTDRAATVLQQRGVTALRSIQGRDAARVDNFVSIAVPLAPLVLGR